MYVCVSDTWHPLGNPTLVVVGSPPPTSHVAIPKEEHSGPKKKKTRSKKNMALRLSVLRSSSQLLRRQVPAIGGALGRAASTSSVTSSGTDYAGRTPERTAELERLAEEHNGFLFGEVVRALSSLTNLRAWLASSRLSAHAQHPAHSASLADMCACPWCPSRYRRVSAGSGRTGSTPMCR